MFDVRAPRTSAEKQLKLRRARRVLTAMHRLIFIAASLVAGIFARAATPAPLDDALKNAGEGGDHWAYTETSLMKDKDGKSSGETIVRVDPSKPYAEQFTPIKINGKPPTEKQLKQYRTRGEKHGEQEEREANAQKEKKDETDTAKADEPARIDINGDNAIIDLEHATVSKETDTSLIYEIPLRRDGAHSLPVEKVQMFVRISKAGHVLENASLRLVAPLRVKFVAKITQGDFSFDFTVVDAKFPPVMTGLKGNISASILFMKKGGVMEQKRTDFKRVKPYNERFGVKVGPLKALSF